MNTDRKIFVSLNHLARPGVAIFQIRRGTQVLEQEVTITGDLKADAAKAARWGIGTFLGQSVKGRLVKAPHEATVMAGEVFEAYGITRSTHGVGQVSVSVPYWTAVLEG